MEWILGLFDIDLKTLILSVILIPVVVYIGKRLKAILKTHADSGFDAASWVIGRTISHQLLTRVSFRQYQRKGLERSSTKYLQVPGVESFSLLTDDIYVQLKAEEASPISTTHRGLEPTSLVTSGSNRRDPKHRSSSKRLIIIGDPGSGKSSYIKHVFRLACRAPRLVAPPLPILVELKHFVPPISSDLSEVDLGEWAIEHLKAIVTNTHGYEMDKLFDTYATKGGLLVLLDGLDEVSTNRYPAVVDALNKLSTRLTDLSVESVVVITMRSQFFSQVRTDLIDEYPEVYRIQAFTPADIYEFLENWPFESAASDNVARIFADLTDRPSLREMCSNPLVLAMYVGNDQLSQDRNSSDTRTSFYGKVVEELLVARRARQLKTQARTVLREQREAILGRLAFENLTNSVEPSNSISWNRAIDVTMAVMKTEDRAEATSHLREIAKETGIFSEERSDESLRFIHLTFCEFLAAKEATEGRLSGWGDLIEFHRLNAAGTSQARTKLIEVLPFAAALLPRAARSSAVIEIASLNDDGVLGRTFLETKEYSSSAWATLIARSSDELLRAQPDDWDDDWLRKLHFLSVLLQDEENWARTYGADPTATLDNLFHNLVKSDRHRLSKVFATYAILDPSASFRLAAAVGVDLLADQPRLLLDNLQSPPFFAIAYAQFRAEPDRVEDWADLFADAGLSSESVVYKLVARPPTRALIEAAARVPVSQRLHTETLAGQKGGYNIRQWRGTLYGYCLSVSRYRGRLRAPDVSHRPNALDLSGIKARRRVLPYAPLRLALSVTLLPLTVAYVGFALGSDARTNSDGNVEMQYAEALDRRFTFVTCFFLSSLVIVSVLSLLTRAAKWRSDIFDALLNLGTWTIVDARESGITWRFSPSLRIARLLSKRELEVGKKWRRAGFLPPLVTVPDRREGHLLTRHLDAEDLDELAAQYGGDLRYREASFMRRARTSKNDARLVSQPE